MSSTTLRDTRQPFTVLLPDAPRTPIEIHDIEVGLAMALVDKSCVQLLDDQWNATGAYVLLGPVKDDSTYAVYVGKSPSGLRDRLMQHERERKWSRALLIRRVVLYGLTSAHAGWLEGDLYDLFSSAQRALVENRQRPRDDTVPPYDLRMLAALRDPIVRVLRMLGYETESAPEALELPLDEPVEATPRKTSRTGLPASQVASRRRKTKTVYSVSLGDLINAGLVRPGDRLVSVSSTWPATAVVNAGGTIVFNGQSYPSMSAAAQAARDGGVANGWDFWALQASDGTTRLSTIRKQHLDSLKSTPAVHMLPESNRVTSSAPSRAPRAVTPATPGFEKKPRKPRTEFNVTVSDLLGAALLRGGDQLVSTIPAEPARATVNYDGTITWNGSGYGSPSTAAQAFRGDRNSNGWQFWAVQGPDGDVQLDKLRKKYLRMAEGEPDESSASPAWYGITMADLLHARLVEAGDLLISTSPSAPAVASVNDDGTVTYEATVYDTPSAAAQTVRRGKATNGWQFWALEKDGTYRRLASVRAEYLDHAEESADA